MIKTDKVEGRTRNRSLKDYAGARFGRLTAVALVRRDTSKENNHEWQFLCDCGQQKLAAIRNVRSGRTRSCGCLFREEMANRNETHGLSKSNPAEYRSWKDMRGRCNNPRNTDFADYGGRGIAATPAWDDFSAFLADMGKRPAGHTLDRIDVNKGYEPQNCRWADATQQANNKRSSRVMELDGRSQTLQQWCREYGADHSKVRYRLSTGLTLRDALQPGDLRSREQTLHRHS